MALICKNYQFDLSRPLVMGIVNVTPDSFSDGGHYFDVDAAIKHAHQLIAEGADILDIGGESTRPGAMPVSEDEELKRVLPIIGALADCGVAISIDTFKPAVMAAAIQAGASMVNDINALQDDLALAVIKQHHVAVCLMHKQGTPQTMQLQPTYASVVDEVQAFLRERVLLVQRAGIALDRIVIDPGFGFGKTLAHNWTLLKELQQFTELGVPVLAGLSRKSMLGAITGHEPEQRVYASVAAALIAVQHGAKIVRVHDVRATVDALKVLQAVSI